MRTILQSALMLTMALMVLTFMGCGEDDPPATGLTSISPANGPKGTTVTFTGISFGADATKIKVFFNDVEAITVTLVSDTEITAKVPAGAFTGDVTLKVDVAEFNAGEFTYELSEAIVSYFAGSGEFGYKDGLKGEAQFSASYNLASDADGNIYVADNRSSAIRKITPDGMVSTLAQDDALFSRPWGIVVNHATGDVYVGSRNWDLITRVSPAGEITKFAGGGAGYMDGQADGTGEQAMFNNPFGLAIDKDGNLFVADAKNHLIRKVTPGGLVSTVAGTPGESGLVDGSGGAAKFNYPSGIDIDADGNMYVGDKNNHVIRKVTPSGVVTTLAGSGEAGFADATGAAAQFNGPWQLAFAADGNLYVHDQDNNRVRMVTLDGVVTTFAGTGVNGVDNGAAASATFYGEGVFATGLATVGYDIYVGGGNYVRKIYQD